MTREEKIKANKPLADRLKQLRENKGVTAKQASQDLNSAISENGFHSIETGYYRPDYEKLVLLAEYYGVTTDWLLGVPKANKEKKSSFLIDEAQDLFNREKIKEDILLELMNSAESSVTINETVDADIALHSFYESDTSKDGVFSKSEKRANKLNTFYKKHNLSGKHDAFQLFREDIEALVDSKVEEIKGGADLLLGSSESRRVLEELTKSLDWLDRFGRLPLDTLSFTDHCEGSPDFDHEDISYLAYKNRYNGEINVEAKIKGLDLNIEGSVEEVDYLEASLNHFREAIRLLGRIYLNRREICLDDIKEKGYYYLHPSRKRSYEDVSDNSQ
ncbi:MAG: helix-turn-helix domain-containing protein [Oscillospiraceae bacterium]|nr:helix-turn-helix domain-containing protein [Oscillospiraceae bacterium]